MSSEKHEEKQHEVCNKKRNLSEISDSVPTVNVSDEERIDESTKGTRPAPISQGTTLLPPPPPPYGSREYWEKRYSRQLQPEMLRIGNNENRHVSQGNNQQRQEYENLNIAFVNDSGSQTVKSDDDGDDNDIVGNNNNNDNDECPHHNWYFEYSELRPLILPLLLGGRDICNMLLAETNQETDLEEDSDEDDVANGKDEEDVKEKNVAENCLFGNTSAPLDGRLQGELIENANRRDEEKLNDETDEIKSSSSSEGHDPPQDVEYEEYSSSEATETEQIRDGLAKNGPIRILEVCNHLFPTLLILS
jgi:hypothetical protein